MRYSVHMRDQKSNQLAMQTRKYRQVTINMLEEITLIVLIWGMFFLSSSS